MPKNAIQKAPDHLTVTLDTWGPVNNLFPSLYDALQSNWGDHPSRMVDNDDQSEPELWPSRLGVLQRQTGWLSLSRNQQEYVDSCFAGKTLPQVLERITFSFLIDGCTRAATHQIVRTRLGAAFMQHGGRDNDWRHRPWVMPETIRRACRQISDVPDDPGKTSPIIDSKPLDNMVEHWRRDIKHSPHSDLWGAHPLEACIDHYLGMGRDLYAALVDAGIPWEDARRLLWMGTSTYIHADYNYLALKGFLERRLEHVMDWEINCVAQLMLREIKMKCPPVFSKYLGSASDKAGKAVFAGLESWPPDGKYPNPFERCGHCLHPEANHMPQIPTSTNQVCEVCERDGSKALPDGTVGPEHEYIPYDTLPREHRPEQNPFWVLHPDSMNGGPIRWIPTNGTYPHEVVNGVTR